MYRMPAWKVALTTASGSGNHQGSSNSMSPREVCLGLEGRPWHVLSSCSWNIFERLWSPTKSLEAQFWAGISSELRPRCDQRLSLHPAVPCRPTTFRVFSFFEIPWRHLHSTPWQRAHFFKLKEQHHIDDPNASDFFSCRGPIGPFLAPRCSRYKSFPFSFQVKLFIQFSEKLSSLGSVSTAFAVAELMDHIWWKSTNISL